jgi:hypothetical protein
MGLVAPIVVSILGFLSTDLAKASDVIRWFGYPFPIYSLTYSFLGLSYRSLFKIIKK